MSNQLSSSGFNVSVNNMNEAMQMATMISNSQLAPQAYKGKPDDTLVAMMMGNELGLNPMQSIQNIAVINGKPSIYGDALLALVKASPLCEYVVETCDGEKATCKAKRKGQPEVVSTFSVDDAKRAKLWGKMGPWSAYPSRMLQMRARGFAIRDAFPDILQGLISREEAEDGEEFEADYEVIPPEPEKATAEKIAAFMESAHAEGLDFFDYKEEIKEGMEISRLREIYKELKKPKPKADDVNEMMGAE